VAVGVALETEGRLQPVVVADGLLDREQGDADAVAEQLLASAEQARADAAALEGVVDGEVAAIGDPGEIGEAAGDADAAAVEPGGDDQLGARDHRGDAVAIVERPGGAEARMADDVDVVVERQRCLAGIGDVAHASGPKTRSKIASTCFKW